MIHLVNRHIDRDGSGMTNPHRLKDLADVQELTKALQLPIDFADQLDPYVQQKFRDLWAPSDVQE